MTDGFLSREIHLFPSIRRLVEAPRFGEIVRRTGKLI